MNFLLYMLFKVQTYGLNVLKFWITITLVLKY